MCDMLRKKNAYITTGDTWLVRSSCLSSSIKDFFFKTGFGMHGAVVRASSLSEIIIIYNQGKKKTLYTHAHLLTKELDSFS